VVKVDSNKVWKVTLKLKNDHIIYYYFIFYLYFCFFLFFYFGFFYISFFILINILWGHEEEIKE